MHIRWLPICIFSFNLQSTFWTRNHRCTICCPTSVTSTLWTDFTMQKHLNYHKPELKDSKNRSSHTALHISNSIYGRYTLFNWHCIFSIFPSVLWHCWLGDRKGIRRVKKLDVGLLVMIWLELCTTYSSSSPVVSTTSIILCFNKHRLTQVHLESGR